MRIGRIGNNTVNRLRWKGWQNTGEITLYQLKAVVFEVDNSFIISLFNKFLAIFLFVDCVADAIDPGCRNLSDVFTLPLT